MKFIMLLSFLCMGLQAQASDSVTVVLSEDYYQGDAVAQIAIDGITIGTTTVTAKHGTSTQQVSFGPILAVGAHNISVTFTNDAYGGSPSTDRNLYVEAVYVNRVLVGGPSSLLSTGSAANHNFTLEAPNQTVRPGLAPLGYRIGYTAHSSTALAELNSVEGWLGRKLDMTAATINMNSWWWGNIPASYAVDVSFPMLSIEGWDSRGANDMAIAASGGYDEYYIAMAKTLAAAGNAMVVRPGWEMNGNWYPWSINGPGGKNQTFANYIATFRRIAAILRRHVPGVKIEFCVNHQIQPFSVGGGGPPDYWPGSDVVDVITMDIYETNTGNWSQTKNNGQYNLNWLTTFAQQQNVKIGLSEWGAANGDADFMRSAIEWMNSLGDRFIFSVYSSWEPADQIIKPGDHPAEQAVWVNAWGKTYFQPRSN